MAETKLKTQSITLENNQALQVKKADGTVVDLAKLDASNLLVLAGLLGVTLPNDIGFVKTKSINFSKDMSTTSSVSITGVGFKPSALICVAVGGTDVDNASVGFCDQSKAGMCIRWQAGTWSYASNRFASLRPGGGGNIFSIYISSFDTDGFTYAVDRFNSPTGTGYFHCLCIK